MTRAEQRALEAYPVKDYNKEPNYIHSCDSKMLDEVYRDVYQQGYKQAEKDTIERAVAWLKDNANKYIVDLTETYPDAPVNIIVGGMCWEDLTQFLKAKEEHNEH